MQFPTQRHFSARASNCQEMNQGLRRNFQPPWPISQRLKWKNLYKYMKRFHSAEWWTLISQWSKFHFPIFLLPKPKVSVSILFQYTNVFHCAKFGDLKPTINEKRRPQIWTCSWARRRNKIPQGNYDFLSTKCFINVNWSSGIRINRVCCWKLETSSNASGPTLQQCSGCPHCKITSVE